MSLRSFFAVFLQAVLPQEFVGPKPDKLLPGDSGAPREVAAAGFARRMLAPVYEALLLFALPGTLLLGAGFLWALIDREGLFLHDRLAGTRIINC